MTGTGTASGTPWAAMPEPKKPGRRRRPSTTPWGENIRARVETLAAEIAMARCSPKETTEHPPSCERCARLDAAEAHLVEAWDATTRRWIGPRVLEWWTGGAIERAWLHLREAEALVSMELPVELLAARRPGIVATAKQCFLPTDERRRSVETWLTGEWVVTPAPSTVLSPAARMVDGQPLSGGRTGRRPPSPPPEDVMRTRYVTSLRWTSLATNDSLKRVRSFRNLVLGASAALFILAAALAAIAVWQPNAIPLCFPAQPTTTSAAATSTTTAPAAASATTAAPTTPPPAAASPSTTTTAPTTFECPTGSSTKADDEAPTGGDVVLVELLGFVGGTLAGAVAIRHVRGTTTPFDVPVALAVLKMPFGALTALTAIVLIHGAFLPGLTSLDTQSQIVAYSLVFGYAQQAITKLVDRQGQTVLGSVPSADTQPNSPGAAEPT